MKDRPQVGDQLYKDLGSMIFKLMYLS